MGFSMDIRLRNLISMASAKVINCFLLVSNCYFKHVGISGLGNSHHDRYCGFTFHLSHVPVVPRYMVRSAAWYIHTIL